MATPTLDVLERLLCDALEAQRRGELHPLGAAAPLEGRREWSRRLTALAGSVRAAAYQPPTAGKPARQALAFAAEALQPLQAALQGCVAAAAEHSTAGNTRRVLERAVELACADLGIQHLATEPLDAGSASTVTLCGAIFVVDASGPAVPCQWPSGVGTDTAVRTPDRVWPGRRRRQGQPVNRIQSQQLRSGASRHDDCLGHESWR
nr:hypothetical protein HK105_007232 [Polyrhizophydium stewartii]